MKNKKSLGQHWLKNREILEKIAELTVRGCEEGAYGFSEKIGVNDEKQSLCVEIGPGLGFLTSSLLKRFEKVIAVEYDAELARKLPGSFPGKNLEVVNEDILEYDFSGLTEGYMVAGNIPYYITSPIIEKLLTLKNLPRRIVLLMQKEVVERITGDKETVLSLMVKSRADVKAGPVVLAKEFTPPPKVDSQVVIMEPYLAGSRVDDEVFRLIKIGFRAPRKKLIHNLTGVKSKEEWVKIFEKNRIDINSRPGDLSLTDWQVLHNNL